MNKKLKKLTLVPIPLFFLNGCIIPAVLGVKEYKSTKDTTEIKFITGMDFSTSLNGIDTVHNEKGIKPTGEK